MRRRAAVLLGASLLAAGVTTGATPVAHADHLSAAGFTCGFRSVTDLTAEPGTHTGRVEGGPIAAAALLGDDNTTVPAPDPADNPVSASITCDLQVNAAFHDGLNVASASSGTTPVVTVLPSTRISYTANEGDIVYLCTTWTLTSADGDTEKLYLDDDGDDNTTHDTGEFRTSPSGAHCAIVATVQDSGGDEPIPGKELIDSIACPVLAIVFPPDGDVPSVWNCPPHGGTEPPPPPSCSDNAGIRTCASLTPGALYEELALARPGTTTVNVRAEVYLYDFDLPNGGVVSLPCVVVQNTDPCAAAGGRRTSLVMTLVDTGVPVPGGPDVPLTTVRVCHADLVLTVNDIGLRTFPAYTVC